MRITLEVQRTLDLEVAARTPRRLFLYRLMTRVRFRQSSGWSDYHTAIIDTGAPYSLIPISLWPALSITRLCAMPVRGIVPGAAAELDAILARVTGQLLDATHRSPRLPLGAMLADTDKVPLILG
jgi:hypothetical protein